MSGLHPSSTRGFLPLDFSPKCLCDIFRRVFHLSFAFYRRQIRQKNRELRRPFAGNREPAAASERVRFDLFRRDVRMIFSSRFANLRARDSSRLRKSESNRMFRRQNLRHSHFLKFNLRQVLTTLTRLCESFVGNVNGEKFRAFCRQFFGQNAD